MQIIIHLRLLFFVLTEPVDLLLPLTESLALQVLALSWLHVRQPGRIHVHQCPFLREPSSCLSQYSLNGPQSHMLKIVPASISSAPCLSFWKSPKVPDHWRSSDTFHPRPPIWQGHLPTSHRAFVLIWFLLSARQPQLIWVGLRERQLHQLKVEGLVAQKGSRQHGQRLN